ncbi:protein O-glucosyltransferase 2-like isoform X2 [Phymastichus coffea]|uniref:protein O-glucosyltransferase 2-like isoform X2 n=1 Tax=Phymastichus coffea TaxID=108790 RepID=UPI00273BD783|nr:protein O-glucosyltransferase 2-like isoform X2 [Phymastichus coffea]
MTRLLILSIFIICYLHYCVESNINDIDALKTFVWGPGLHPEDITLRARYIYLQLVDSKGINITEPIEDKIVSFAINGITKDKTPCRIWPQVLDCKDASFIFRYRIYNTCFNLSIIIKVKNQIVPLQKSFFKGPVYEEECYCPNTSVQSWLKNNFCSKSKKLVNENLMNFPRVNFDVLRDNLISTFNKPKSISICHYVVKSNNVHRKCFGEHVGFKTFYDAILLSITRKTVLPDVEFFANLGDWPLVEKNTNIEMFPIFSWCGHENFNDVVLPTYELTESSVEGMGRVMLDMLSVQGNTKLPWSEKIEKVFWRGRDSNMQRLNLIDIARKNPSLFNVSMTNFFFSNEDQIKKYGPKQKHVSFFDFFEYKYQLNIDGTVAAYRFPYLLAGDSLVFKQNSKYFEFFYQDFEADKHFITVNSDLSDLIEKVKWAMRHDDEAHKVTKIARQYARDNLMPQNIFCYLVALIEEWSKRIQNPINIFPEMEHVTQPEYECECTINEEQQRDEL